ncbi:GMC oxidoreductase [Chitinophaga flava]|uniref:Cholesterol oxidase n=1 Tax=Chitinophaga flava TaxID=2259036 RepID=A0A365XTI4_9BACT|nr:GMC oxidoreductase [Chitinophaga flava]RBL89450.1 GMC family oxidoreductase [Chitinophaga flava]
MSLQYDYVIIGSGFGGSVGALRLVEKGYKVLVIEKGRRFKDKDFPKTNWDLRKWLWAPLLKFRGAFRISFFRHVAVMHGVGVGGGSLVYAAALPMPPAGFFYSGHWQGLAEWEQELKPFYTTARRMLGSAPNPRLETGDHIMKDLATEMGRAEHFSNTEVGIFLGEPGRQVKDPYFNGLGPDRSGCTFCGGCLIGCRHNAKNSLDKNYLYLAQQAGVEIMAETTAYDVIPLDGANGATGYEVKFKTKGHRQKITSHAVIFAGGVLGTVNLLLKLKNTSLPRLSSMVGEGVRTNNESIVAMVNYKQNKDLSRGVAIGSVLKLDDTTYVEPFRYNKGSGAWRLFLLPFAHANTFVGRVGQILIDLLRYPWINLKTLFVDDFGKRTQALLFMQQGEQSLRLKRGWLGLKSVLKKGAKPTPFMPMVGAFAHRYGQKLEGKPYMLSTEALLGIPSTAHLLGGAVMGRDTTEGVIDKDNHVFGYENMFVCDGAMISSNPGVNPSLTITAIVERAMSKIKPKSPVVS